MDIPIQLQSVGKLKGLQFCQETVRFTGTDDNNSKEIFSDDVTIVPSSGNHKSGSSKVKLKNVVDFSWEHRFYMGQLLAVHVGGKFVAYGIKVSKDAGVVRVVNRENGERSLLKGMKGMVQDIAFAHIPSQIVLASVDEFGNLLVHQIEEIDKTTKVTLLLHVEHSESSLATNHRVIWCPYVPDEDNENSVYDDVAKLLVLTHDTKAEMWNIGMVTARHGVGPLWPGNVEVGYLEINEHSKPIIDASFSPDGTALATASLDGDVKFFQVYMLNESKPRCLHRWQPHGGKPLSSLFFLDNHKSYNPEVQFWKYAVTGAENNSEIKVWSCESWTCLQTIRFTPEHGKQDIILKAGLDLGAGYLLLSDIFHNVLYVLELHVSSSETCAFVRSVSEFLLPCPILSFGIVDAALRKFKGSSFSLEELCSVDGADEGDDDAQTLVQAVVVRMYLVQPKSLQECHIAFQPPASTEDPKLCDTLSHDSLMFLESFSDMSIGPMGTSVTELDSSIQDLPANHLSESIPPANCNSQQQPLNLMTPDAFSSPARKDSPTETKSLQVPLHADTSPHLSRLIDSSISSSPTLKTLSSPIEDTHRVPVTLHSKPCVEQPLATSDLQEAASIFQREGFASGGSSPSREVQEILSLKSPECLNHSYYDDKVLGDDSVQVKPVPESSLPQESRQYEDVITEKDAGMKPVGPEKDGWPQIPILLADEVRKSEENSSKRTSLGLQDNLLTSNVELENKIHNLCKSNQKLDGFLTTMDQKINLLMDLVQDQQMQIKELREENQLAVQRADNSSPLINPHLEAMLLGQVDAVVGKYQQQQAVMVEELLLTKDDMERKRQETLMSAISQAVSNLVATKLEDIVIVEIKDNIVPVITNMMDTLKHQLHVEFTQKLTSTDHLLKENIAKLVQSNSVKEVLSNSMVGALQPAVQATLKDVFASLVVPNFEKTCHNMFVQINETFSRGTKEYVQILDSNSEKQRRQQEKGRDLLAQVQALSESMRMGNSQLITTVQKEVQKLSQMGLESIQDSLNKSVGETVKEHIAQEFRSQQTVIEDSVMSAVRSRAVTPAPHVLDSQVQQAQILQLISQGQINAAFQQALSASDLGLVVFICERVNPQQVFNQTPCPLQQPVLLSLIQQLSADMSNHTEIKHKYLEEAVMNLDTSNVLTREHMPNILTKLQHQLTSYIATNPNNKITRSMKMLNMATQSLLNASNLVRS